MEGQHGEQRPGPRAEDDPAPGWDAIDAALTPHYGPRPVRHVGYNLPAAVSTNLQGCSAYLCDDHWFFVSYGLSELYSPGPHDDPDRSGWGFELTLRVARFTEEVPPAWPFAVLNEIARYVRGNEVLLAPGHRIDLRSPITGYPNVPDAPNSPLTVFALAVDPLLGEISTPNGRLLFLEMVGVTAGEKAEMVRTSTCTVLQRLAADNPLLVTDPTRGDGACLTP